MSTAASSSLALIREARLLLPQVAGEQQTRGKVGDVAEESAAVAERWVALHPSVSDLEGDGQRGRPCGPPRAYR